MTSVSSSLPTHGHSFALSRQGLLGASNNESLSPRGESYPLLDVFPWSSLRFIANAWVLQEMLLNIKHKLTNTFVSNLFALEDHKFPRDS